MPGKVIGKSMNYGFPGTVSGSRDAVIETYPVKSDSADIQFGDPVVLNSDGTVSKFAAASTAAATIGIALKTVKQAYDESGNAKYKPGDACDVLTRGRVSVKCVAGTPAPQGTVYVRAATGTGLAIGDIVATSDTTNTVAMTNMVWATDKKDAYNTAELSVLTRHI